MSAPREPEGSTRCLPPRRGEGAASPASSRRQELRTQPEESGRAGRAGKGEFPRRVPGVSGRNGSVPCPLRAEDPRETDLSHGPLGAAPRPWPGGLRGPGRGAGRDGEGRPADARILPQAGVHLAFVGPGLPVAPVFLVHELVLVVLIHVHLPEPGRRHRVLRHPGSGPAARASSGLLPLPR